MIQRKASTSGLPVSVVGGAPRPRPGGLHQRVPFGPWPLRLVSITKWAPLRRFERSVPNATISSVARKLETLRAKALAPTFLSRRAIVLAGCQREWPASTYTAALFSRCSRVTALRTCPSFTQPDASASGSTITTAWRSLMPSAKPSIQRS